MSTINVTIPDPALNELLHVACDVPLGTPLTSDDLASLSTLDASNSGITDLEGMQYCINLLNLNLSDNEIKDTTPLIGLTLLISLNLSENLNLLDEAVQKLSSLINIQNLILTQSMIQSVNFASNMTKLINLDASRCLDLIDLHGISYLPALAVLDLSDSKQITDISALSTLPNLVYLELTQCPFISNMEVLGKITSLTELIIIQCGETNISYLNTLSNLENLNFKDNFVSDISFVSNLHKLNYISFTNNKVSDLTPLKQLTLLETFIAPENLITTLSPILDLPLLTLCTISNNYLTDFGEIAYLISKSVSLHFEGNFFVSQVDQYAFNHFPEITFPSGKSQDNIFEIYLCTGLDTYTSSYFSGHSGFEYFTVQSTDSNIFVATGQAIFSDDKILYMNTEMTGISPGEAALQILYTTPNQTPVKLPFASGDYEFKVTIS
ncbi:putative surface protein [Rahnella aquatilis CIP 78.65 = ATCC 33071]|uniref:Leucine Rich Repeat (LRR)-containing protein n=1 Tax=Rahnella aquatilis (strain ATCC 33071 / DSM 4594 / JCM 1683 / NBRC 105701 / NCIMB 13365 / CIP 78.65) TaxID=745277 RepID=H2IVE6_RAHAC|nr:leucine-rich repeat domain-containing protein [Rahnella aquatilis]AEX51733.1 hypothetical protein Rahaq2_1867 [Rahnella aquatilis CIP 78.65 = ATCC 33071]KFD16152.1 putative surface protein [Rahnella aquatilis CIP 78.65 = ATCC 33071]